MSSLFSVPVAVILNQRLISQRGGIVTPTSQFEDSLRFKLFINSNPSSVRYGLTFQISALRDMSRELNIDQIPEHQAYIFFPTSNFFHYDCMPLSQTGIQRKEMKELDITEEQANEINRMVRMFRIKGDTNFNELRYLTVKCTAASIDKESLPKLRSERLECEFRRIFGTIKTANELEDASLEIDCLLPATNGATDLAVWGMHNAAQKDLDVSDMKKRVGEKEQLTPGEGSQRSWRPIASMAKPGTSSRKPTTSRQNTPTKPIVSTIIDGKFASPEKTTISRKDNSPLIDQSKDYTPKTSPQKYLHPHTFDSENAKQVCANGSDKNTPSPKKVLKPPKAEREFCHKEGHTKRECEVFRAISYCDNCVVRHLDCQQNLEQSSGKVNSD